MPVRPSPRRLVRPAWGAAPLLAAALVACGPSQTPPTAEAPADTATSAAAAGYLAPPELAGATRSQGQVTLRGRAAPGAQVTLAAPDGFRSEVRAGSDGAWSVAVPAPEAPRLFALSARVGERVIPAQGAVVVLPGTGAAALLARAGYAALPLETGAGGLRIVALDYDTGGGAAIAGVAAPKARVSLSIDGEPAGLAQADSDGRFAVMASNQALTPGLRRIEVATDRGRASVRTPVSVPAPLGSPYRVERQPGGWRVDWAPSGGGVQTTVVFDAPEAAS
jgi:hypothetical protein